MPDTNMERKRHNPQVLVDTENLTREEWLDWRRRGIGGSDVSAIIGLSLSVPRGISTMTSWVLRR